jgi:hypothetical protein
MNDDEFKILSVLSSGADDGLTMSDFLVVAKLASGGLAKWSMRASAYVVTEAGRGFLAAEEERRRVEAAELHHRYMSQFND